MSSKSGRKVWSLSTRLLVWYSTATAVVTGVTIGAVYLGMAVQLDKEADKWLREGANYLAKYPNEASSNPDLWMTNVALVLDRTGQAQFSSSQLLQQFSANSFPKEGYSGTDRIGSDGRTYRLLSVRHDGCLYLFAQDRSFETEFMATLRRNIVMAAIPSFVISMIIGYMLARTGMQPIKNIILAARAVSPIHLHGRVPVEGQPADLRELAQTLNSVLEKMEDAFGRLDAFSADVAHELRTPVQNLRGSIEIALSQDRTPDEYRQTLAVALNEVDRLRRLVDRLLILAQSEDPRREVQRDCIDVSAELEDICEFFAAAASESGVSLGVASPLTTEFLLDRSLFQRAVSNLVSNALAHTSSGGTINLSSVAERSDLIVTVADTGVGIDKEELPYLFDRFYRSRSLRNSARGVGLGLAIVKRVVDLHGGKIRIDSARGVGTKVEMTFPGCAHSGTHAIASDL